MGKTPQGNRDSILYGIGPTLFHVRSHLHRSHVASQKVFRLGVVGATEHFLNKNISPPGHGEQPQDHRENESDRKKIRRPVAVSDLHGK